MYMVPVAITKQPCSRHSLIRKAFFDFSPTNFPKKSFDSMNFFFTTGMVEKAAIVVQTAFVPLTLAQKLNALPELFNIFGQI